MNCTQRNLATSFGVALFLYFVYVAFMSKEKYELSPSTITLKGNPPQKTLRDLKYDISCVPGAQQGSYYTKDLTPGGFCGDQALVNAAMHSYEIESGIGGSLLDE